MPFQSSLSTIAGGGVPSASSPAVLTAGPAAAAATGDASGKEGSSEARKPPSPTIPDSQRREIEDEGSGGGETISVQRQDTEVRQSLLPQGGEADRPGRPSSPEHRQSPEKGDGNRQDERGDLSISETSAVEKTVSPSGDSRTQIQAEAAAEEDECPPSPHPSFRVAENKKDGESVCDSAGTEAQNPIQQQASLQSPVLSRSPSPFPAPSSSPVKTAALTSVPVSTTPSPKEDPRPSESTVVGEDDAEAKSSTSPDPPAADPEEESQVPREQRLSPPSSTADKEAEEASAEKEDAAQVAPSSPPVEAAVEAEAEALSMPSTSPSSESLSSSQKQPSSPSSTVPHSAAAAAAVAAPTTVASYPVTSSVSCPTVCDIRQSEEVKPASPEPEKEGKPTENSGSSSTPVAPCPPEQPLLQESLLPPTESSTGEDIPADKKEVSRVEVEDRRETSGGSGEIFATLTECSPPSDGAASKSADSQGEVRFS